MGPRLHRNAAAITLAGTATLLVAWMSLGQWQWTDYDSEARPALDALLAGHVSQFFGLAPAYGGSLLLRAPFALIAKLTGGGELAIFRLAAAPCLAAAAVLGVWLAAASRRMGRARSAGLLALVVCVANPLTFTALKFGHPEELLGGVLCVAAVLAAGRGRPVWAGVLLGLAIANKEWAAVALGPVLVALPDRRWRALIACGAVAAVVLAPFALVGSSAFVGQVNGATHTGTLFNPWQAWWFIGTHSIPAIGSTGVVKLGYRSPPGWIAAVAHPLIVAVTVPLTLFCLWLARRGRPRPRYEGLLLLMLALLLRVALDPWSISYYAVPFLTALVVWEALARDRLPVTALAGTLAAWLVLEGTSGALVTVSPDTQALAFLVVAIPAVAAIGSALYAPGLAAAMRAGSFGALTGPSRLGWRP